MRSNFPIEPYNNSIVLPGKSNSKLKIRCGATRWGRTEWIGKLYPEGAKENQFLANYVQHFNGIELHATHFVTYPLKTIEKWAMKAEGRDFLFCTRIPQSISHYSSFTDIEDKTNRFLDGIYGFEDHLGPILLQVSDRFSPKRKDNMLTYLQSLPKDLQLFLEVGNPQWFEDDVFQALIKRLGEDKIGLTISDNDERPLLLDLTVPKCWIRYTPCGDYSRLDHWYQKIKEWEDKGLREAYFFVQPGEDPHQQLDELLYFKNLVDNA